MKTNTQMMLWSLALAASLALAPATARAEEGADSKPKMERREGGPAQRLEMLRERLGLDEEQAARLKEIFAAEREEMRAKRKELGRDVEREEVREAMKAIHEGYIPKIEAVLTPEQREKWAKMRERMQERMQERREGGGPGGEGKAKGEGKKRRAPGEDAPADTAPGGGEES